MYKRTNKSSIPRNDLDYIELDINKKSFYLTADASDISIPSGPILEYECCEKCESKNGQPFPMIKRTRVVTTVPAGNDVHSIDDDIEWIIKPKKKTKWIG